MVRIFWPSRPRFRSGLHLEGRKEGDEKPGNRVTALLYFEITFTPE